MGSRPLARDSITLALALLGFACRSPGPTLEHPVEPAVADESDAATDDDDDDDHTLESLPGDGGDIVHPNTRVTISSPTITGAVHPELVRRRIRSHAGLEQIRRCWESHAPSEIATGSFVMKFGVSVEGEVVDAAITSAEPRLDPVARCIERFVGELSFPAEMPGTVELALTIAPYT